MKPRLLDLPHGCRTLIDEEDWERVSALTVYLGSNGYAYFSEWHDGQSHPQLLHRWLMEPPPGAHVDHLNGNKLDNRRVNLRITTPSLNQVNRKHLNRNNTSGVRGVAYRPELSRLRPWHAQITVARKNIYLGMHTTRAAAIEARKAAEMDLWGEAAP